MAWAALIPLAVSLASMAINANKKKPTRPDYEIPDEVSEELRMSRIREGQNMPGYYTQKEELLTDQATNIQALKEAGGASQTQVIGGLSDISENVISGTRDIDLLNLQYKDEKTRETTAALRNMAEYKDKEFEYDVHFPFIQEYGEYLDQRMVNQENIMGAIGDTSANIIASQGLPDGKSNKITKKSEGTGRDRITTYFYGGEEFETLTAAMRTRRLAKQGF